MEQTNSYNLSKDVSSGSFPLPGVALSCIRKRILLLGAKVVPTLLGAKLAANQAIASESSTGPVRAPLCPRRTNSHVYSRYPSLGPQTPGVAVWIATAPGNVLSDVGSRN